ncbi:hypothetical protein PHLGIDRAFT_77794 [Phlebiopsis gigantea 11061_1 CR5-6]|uniref:Prenylcysteine lyase domain-containing protein n=1 Tax=Phlebiopsis gigantea (strain 11061_1 CR5-6) TaxID=745531 RepID=A0A0C3S1U0_PHLG1|nr:hypothetical protein PHLGIDRAFT_77794 [Phlebiopsis gigantea 11061_1 CR5-6]
MYLATALLVTYGLSEAVSAFKLPFHLPWVSATSNDEQVPLALPPQDHTPRIAIVGAGAGGSSAAFWISKAKERYGLDVEVDIFDSNSYVGGRSTTVQPYDDPELDPIELGASIFVKINKNMWRASEEFGFERVDFDDSDDTLGIWDGSKFVLTSKLGGWWDTVRVIWRYGYKAPTRTKSMVENMMKDFTTLYTPLTGSSPWSNITALTYQLEWTDVVSQSTMDYFDSQGIDSRWTREMIEAATRVNYGQNIDQIHALEGMCSLAATGASQIKGGNWKIFEQFVKRSQANVFLNTTVKSIAEQDGKYFLRAQSKGPHFMERNYNAVIIAAPFHSAEIDLSLTSAAPVIPPQPYVHLHVTLLSTPNPHPRTRFFGLGEKDKVPTTVLTTWEGVRQGEENPAPEFNSLSYHGSLKFRNGTIANTSASGEPEYSVKIFSKQKLEDSYLRKAFGKIGWVHRKEWDAYPILPPTTSFPPVKLAKGLYYVNSFEPFISTMETETISARNAVELLMRDQFNASICKSEPAPEGVKPSDDKEEDFIYGWDC